MPADFSQMLFLTITALIWCVALPSCLSGSVQDRLLSKKYIIHLPDFYPSNRLAFAGESVIDRPTLNVQDDNLLKKCVLTDIRLAQAYLLKH